MAMVDVDDSSLQLAWSVGRQPVGAVPHSSDKPGEL